MRRTWIAAIALIVSACTPFARVPSRSLEDMYVLRSIRDPATSTSDGCVSSQTGFEPFASDAERTFSFWSISSDPNGHVVNTKVRRLPPPYVGGLLTTNAMTSAAAFGGDTEPLGYTQASIATIRLWRKK